MDTEEYKKLSEYITDKINDAYLEGRESQPQMQSKSIATLAAALARAQNDITGAHKDAVNPFYQKQNSAVGGYATLSSVWAACHKHLSKNELAVIQTTKNNGKAVVVFTTLAHSSGEWIKGELQITPSKDDAQGIGSAITYARRYALSAMVGICPDDDDGNNASGKNGTDTNPKDELQNKYEYVLKRLNKCKATPEVDNVKEKYVVPIWDSLNDTQKKSLADTASEVKANIQDVLSHQEAAGLPESCPAEKKEALSWHKTKIQNVYAELKKYDKDIFTQEWFDDMLHQNVNKEYKTIMNARMVDVDKVLPDFLEILNNELEAAGKNDVPF
jgi:hypothetical protein